MRLTLGPPGMEPEVIFIVLAIIKDYFQAIIPLVSL